MLTAPVRAIVIAALLAAAPSLAAKAAAPAEVPATPAATSRRAPAAAGPCRAGETAVVVDTRAHRMHLCARGEVRQSFVVALGTRGVGKQHRGDNRTPLGKYPLGAPRASQSFHRFVPVAYPTPAQARLGFTGSAIGIHGPPRGLAGLAAGLAPVDWTAGCIAVDSDEEIDAVASWIRREDVKTVRLEW